MTSLEREERENEHTQGTPQKKQEHTRLPTPHVGLPREIVVAAFTSPIQFLVLPRLCKHTDQTTEIDQLLHEGNTNIGSNK